MALGDAYVDIHADTSPFDRELARWDPGAGRYRDVASGKFVAGFTDAVDKGFERATRPGGPFSKIGEGIRDAIGAGANVSGKSPLISVLGPVYGELGLLIAAAAQGVNGLAAALTTLPALLTAIGLQAGVLFAAFHGVGDAIKGAFKAKDANELNEAIKNLTPSAQAFVRSLLPLRDLLKQISAVAQESFFRELGNTVSQIAASLGPLLSGGGVASLAAALGRFAETVGDLLASPLFKGFLTRVIQETVTWLDKFRFAFSRFLEGLLRISEASLPFLRFLGQLLGDIVNTLGEWMSQGAASGGFSKWLNDMIPTFQSLLRVVKGAADLIGAFFSALDKAGGKGTLDAVAEQLEKLAFMLDSEFGMYAIKGIVIALEALGLAFFGLASVVLLVGAMIGVAYASIKEFFTWLFTVAGPAIGHWFTETLPNALTEAWTAVSTFFSNIFFKVQLWMAQIGHNFSEGWNNILTFLRGIPGRILGIIGDAYHWLIQKGKDLVQGFIDGIRSALPALGSIASSMISKVAGFLPGSPAKEGPLSGSGYVMYRGQRMVQDFAKGIGSETNELNSAGYQMAGSVFNTNLNFYGQQPTQSQAKTAGRAVSSELDSQIAQRSTRLAVRMA